MKVKTIYTNYLESLPSLVTKKILSNDEFFKTTSGDKIWHKIMSYQYVMYWQQHGTYHAKTLKSIKKVLKLNKI